MFKFCSFQIADVEKVKKFSAYSSRSLKYFNLVSLVSDGSVAEWSKALV